MIDMSDEAKVQAELVQAKRTTMAPVQDAHAYPNCCVCHLEMRDGNGRQKTGTGWFVGRNTVITAAHNLISSDFRARSVYVYAGRSPRQGSVWSGPGKWYDVHPDWRGSAKPACDVAAVWVEQEQDRVGNLRVIAPGQSLAKDQGIAVAGYPKTLPYGAQGHARGALLGIRDGRIDHGLPTAEGVSGGPIWILDSDGMAQVVGIHTHAPSVDGTEAVLITDPISQLIRQWRDGR